MIINQLRRNVFNLDLKREIVAAKTNVKHSFLFNSHLVSMVQTDPDIIQPIFLNMCILLRLPAGWDQEIKSTLKKAFFNQFESLFYRCIDQDCTRLVNFVSLIMTVQLVYLKPDNCAICFANCTAATRLPITLSFNKMKIQPTAYLIGFPHDEAIT